MLFNSIEFAIFIPIVFFSYWVLNRNIKLQNTFLIIASYVFYGWWDWRFLSLIAFSSLVDYSVGLGFQGTKNQIHRKLLLITSITVNIGLLGIFKYYNFFAENFSKAFTFFGVQITDYSLLEIVLPVGISFYTFQTLSYSIDVYRRKIKPTKDITAFFAFVSFFPQLVAGPIERATNLLPQFLSKRTFHYDNAVDGMRQILWGLFKKMLIADNCAVYVDSVFSNYGQNSGSTLLAASFLFSFQIYCDFSGYSDIAIGTSRLFGFKLRRNFAFPYFSRDIAEFWRRWHISLSTWFRDYVYIPLGGSRGSKLIITRNVIIIFALSGLWHGANWTFVVWGLLNAVYFLPLILRAKNKRYSESVCPGMIVPPCLDLINILKTFSLTTFAWIFFRSNTMGDALSAIEIIFSPSILTFPSDMPMPLYFGIPFLVAVEWLQRERQHGLHELDVVLPKILRWPIYYGLVICILKFGQDGQQFIYFQF